MMVGAVIAYLALVGLAVYTTCLLGRVADLNMKIAELEAEYEYEHRLPKEGEFGIHYGTTKIPYPILSVSLPEGMLEN